MVKLFGIIYTVLILVSCNDSSTEPKQDIYPLKVYPVVITSLINSSFDELYNTLSRPKICDVFINSYPDSLDKEFQNHLISYARKKVDSLSLDVNIFNQCLEAAGINSKNDTCFYPLYFQESLVNGKGVWNIASVYEIDFKVIKIKDLYSVSVDKKTFHVTNVHNYLPLEPEVRITNTNYDTLSVVKTYSTIRIAQEFRNRYKNIYYRRLRTKVDEAIIASLNRQNQNAKEFLISYNSALMPFSFWTLPCAVESAKFMNKDVWIIEFVYGYMDYGHFIFYVIDKKTHKILYEDGCL